MRLIEHTVYKAAVTNDWVKINPPAANKNLAMLDHNITATLGGPTLCCLLNKSNQEMQRGQVEKNQPVLIALPS